MMLKREGRLNRPNITSTKDEQDGSVAQHDEYKITSIPTAKSFLEDGNRILYRRDQSKRFPQLLIGGTIIHSGYWFWYVTDFTNTLSDAGLQVSEHIGGLGFGFSVMMMAAATLYPRHLISEIIVASGGTGQVVVKLHTLPFARPENDGKIYARGDLSIGTEADKMKLEKNEGFKNQTGHMAIDASDKRLNILLDTSNADLIDEEGLTQMLLGRLVK